MSHGASWGEKPPEKVLERRAGFVLVFVREEGSIWLQKGAVSLPDHISPSSADSYSYTSPSSTDSSSSKFSFSPFACATSPAPTTSSPARPPCPENCPSALGSSCIVA